jgi:hypothetical protein
MMPVDLADSSAAAGTATQTAATLSEGAAWIS